MKPKKLKRLDAQAREAIVKLTAERDALQVRLDVADLRCEQLALLNEQMRSWLEANVACAVAVGRQMGIPEPSRHEPAAAPHNFVSREELVARGRNGKRE